MGLVAPTRLVAAVARAVHDPSVGGNARVGVVVTEVVVGDRHAAVGGDMHLRYERLLIAGGRVAWRLVHFDGGRPGEATVRRRGECDFVDAAEPRVLPDRVELAAVAVDRHVRDPTFRPDWPSGVGVERAPLKAGCDHRRPGGPGRALIRGADHTDALAPLVV